MKTRTKIIIVAGLLISIGLIWASTRPERRVEPKQKDTQKTENNEDLEFLKALPYVQWSDTKGNEKEKGVTLYDEKLAYPGYNLYTNDENEIYLTDMKGKRVHTWQIPDKKNCEYAELLEDASLIVVCVNQAILKLDWDSNPIWDHDYRVHHDVEVLPDGTYLTLQRRRTTYKDQEVVFDSVIHVSQEGKILQKWNTAEKIDIIAKHHPTHPMENPNQSMIQQGGKKPPRIDYYHMNTVQLLPETELGKKDKRFKAGNIIVCFRNVNLIAILDRNTMEIVWTWGPGEVQLPHMPTMLPNGHILIYDNGTHRKYSRVIELEPVKGEIVWEYQGNPPKSFFSHWQGSAQRLPNGNTLICESTKAFVFEVTMDGKIVWKFWSPEVQETRRKRIYRFLRLPKEQVDPILARLNHKK